MGNKYGDIRYKWLAERGFNVKSDQYQLDYVESLFADVKDVKTVFVNALSGTGKTTISTLVGAYELDKGNYEKLTYLRSPISVVSQGFIPGTLDDKESIHMQPFVEALDKLHFGMYEKLAFEEVPKVKATTTANLRGVNFENNFCIIDECQNLSLVEMQTVMTRFHDNCKVVCIGSTEQNDNGKNLIKGKTPFEWYMELFKEKPYARIHELHTNFRGDVSKHSDTIQKFIKNYEVEGN